MNLDTYLAQIQVNTLGSSRAADCNYLGHKCTQKSLYALRSLTGAPEIYFLFLNNLLTHVS